MQNVKIKLSYIERNGIPANENFYIHFNENQIIGSGKCIFEKGRLLGELNFDHEISEDLFCYLLYFMNSNGEINSFNGLNLVEREKSGIPTQRLREMMVE